MARFEISPAGAMLLPDILSIFIQASACKNVFYLVGPITGIEDKAEAIFDQAKKDLSTYLSQVYEEDEYFVLTPYNWSRLIKVELPYTDYMIISATIIKIFVDNIVLVDINDNWLNSRGTLSELTVAATNNIEILYLSDIVDIDKGEYKDG